MITAAEAVASLRPNVEWSMNGHDIEGIIWHTEGVIPLTQQEVEAEIIRLKQEEDNKIAAQQKAREDAIAHAKSLGFTDEMIAVMYPGLVGGNE